MSISAFIFSCEKVQFIEIKKSKIVNLFFICEFVFNLQLTSSCMISLRWLGLS
jgi:hypothetical protein